MKKIRIGNDIKVIMTITNNNAEVNLTGRRLGVFLQSAYGQMTVREFAVEENRVSFTWPGAWQNTCGVYYVTVCEYGEGGHQQVVDTCDAFELIPRTAPVMGGDSGTVATETVSLAADISLRGSDGKSAYEIAVEHGFTGSETAWLESLRGPQGSLVYPVFSVSQDMELMVEGAEEGCFGFSDDGEITLNIQ